jgi:polar amino acid transport system substrate-binding protein
VARDWGKHILAMGTHMKDDQSSGARSRLPMTCVALAVCALSTSAWAQDQDAANTAKQLSFVTTQIPSFASLKDGKPIGFAVEILREIMRRLDRTDGIEFGDWKSIYKRTLDEPNTVLLPPSRTPEREDKFKWVGPLIPEKLVLFARKDSKLVISSLDEAKKASGVLPS